MKRGKERENEREERGRSSHLLHDATALVYHVFQLMSLKLIIL